MSAEKGGPSARDGARRQTSGVGSTMTSVTLNNARCEGITAAGEQCRCWATERINNIPYCRQHAAKELRAIAMIESTPQVRP
jgi:hypothetical protein